MALKAFGGFVREEIPSHGYGWGRIIPSGEEIGYIWYYSGGLRSAQAFEGHPRARVQRLPEAAREAVMNDSARYESLPIEKLRDRVMDDLVRQYSLERVDLPEFERRTDIVSRAATRSELIAQVSDLPGLPNEGRAAARTSASPGAAGWRVGSENARPNDYAVAIFSGSDFKGVWQAPRSLTALCVFGGASIDFRRAIVPEEGVTVSCLCLFGGVDIVVPPGMRVRVRGIGIFGGFDRTENEVEDPAAPTIVVEGLALFGGVSVRVRP